MRRILVDVDTQADFVHESGALHVPAAPSVPAAIASLLAQAQAAGDPILGSVDSHAWDAWEFVSNGGSFPAHCVKGSQGWLRVNPELPARTRFVPLQVVEGRVRNLVAALEQGQGTRELDARALAGEALAGVGVYFEKEVYSLFANPVAQPVVEALVAALGGPHNVRFEVMGYCTGGYCVDAAVKGLLDQGYAVNVLSYATAAIGGAQGQASSRAQLSADGAQWIEVAS